MWRICCTNWGDYTEVVVTDNGDNTVNITRTPVRMKNTTATRGRSEVEYNVDNTPDASGNTPYVSGTTKEPVGITMRQCGLAVISANVFASINDKNHTFEEFQYFNSQTTFKNYGNFVKCIGRLIFPPRFVSWQDDQPYTQSVLIYEFPETLTRFHLSRGGINKKDIVLVFKGATPPTLNFGYFNPTAAGNTCYIYVPDNAIDVYKQAATFSDYQQFIHPLSEYKWYEHLKKG